MGRQTVAGRQRTGDLPSGLRAPGPFSMVIAPAAGHFISLRQLGRKPREASESLSTLCSPTCASCLTDDGRTFPSALSLAELPSVAAAITAPAIKWPPLPRTSQSLAGQLLSLSLLFLSSLIDAASQRMERLQEPTVAEAKTSLRWGRRRRRNVRCKAAEQQHSSESREHFRPFENLREASLPGHRRGRSSPLILSLSP